MSAESFIAKGLVRATEVAAETALGQEALSLMKEGITKLVPDSVKPFLDEEGAKLIAALHGEDRKAFLSAQFDYLGKPTSAQIMKAIAGLPAQHMEPEAFKILTVDGHSPNFAGRFKWSLPRLENGKWTPGAWMDVSHKEIGMDGLFISNNAERWLNYYGKSGRPPVKAFHVQIGDLPSRTLWKRPLAGTDPSNFRAKTVRLLAPVE